MPRCVPFIGTMLDVREEREHGAVAVNANQTFDYVIEMGFIHSRNIFPAPCLAGQHETLLRAP